MSTHDLDNFCFAALIVGGTDHNPMSIEEARYTLECWRNDAPETAEAVAGLTPARLMRAWSAACRYLDHT